MVQGQARDGAEMKYLNDLGKCFKRYFASLTIRFDQETLGVMHKGPLLDSQLASHDPKVGQTWRETNPSSLLPSYSNVASLAGQLFTQARDHGGAERLESKRQIYT